MYEVGYPLLYTPIGAVYGPQPWLVLVLASLLHVSISRDRPYSISASAVWKKKLCSIEGS